MVALGQGGVYEQGTSVSNPEPLTADPKTQVSQAQGRLSQSLETIGSVDAEGIKPRTLLSRGRTTLKTSARFVSKSMLNLLGRV